jgi:hypothetical protein
MLLPPPRFCSTMFCGIAKGFALTCTCIVLDLTVSGELDRSTSVSVGVFSNSSSAGKPLERGIVYYYFLLATVTYRSSVGVFCLRFLSRLPSLALVRSRLSAYRLLAP